MGTVQKPRERGMSTSGSHYLRTKEDRADREHEACAAVNCRTCKLAIVVDAVVVMNLRCQIQLTIQTPI
jgi:hypothetical protein